MNLKELIRLTRFEHALMLALGVLIAETIVLGAFPKFSLAIILSLFVPIFSEMGSFAMNDYLDIEADKLNKPDRPLVKGTVSPAFALYFSIAALILSSTIALFINQSAFFIAIAFNILAVAYNWRIKDLPLAGNAYIALTMAIPFVFGNFVVSAKISTLALLLASLGFIAGLAREIIKSVQDMEADVKARKSRTLPVVIGKKNALIIAIALYILFVPISFLPFIYGLPLSVVPLLLVCIADFGILLIVYKVIVRNDFRFARNMSLLAFLLGLVGIMIAALG